MDTFQSILPNHNELDKHIAYYYFHESKDDHFSQDIIYHPHYLIALNVYNKVEIQWNEHGKIYLPAKSNAKQVVLTLNNKTSKEVMLRGAFEKIGVVFYPLGINHFVEAPLHSLVQNNRASNFDHFGSEFLTLSQLVFNSPELEEKRALLNTFFENRLKTFEENRIIKAVDRIMNASEVPKTQELADQIGVSRKTLLRLFKMHLCFTVEEFKSVVRFRKALELYEESLNKPPLSHIAYDTKYYDQSDFINHFKSITGLNPKKFFSSIHDVSNAGTYWTIKSK